MGFSSDISPNTKSLPNVKFGVVVFNRRVVLLVMLHSGIVPCGFLRSTNTVKLFPKSKLIGFAFMPGQDSIKIKTKKLNIAALFM